MMEVGKLTVQHRGKTGKGISRSTRREGDVPGVCYGAGLDNPLAITVNPKALRASFDPAKRRNTVIDLTIEQEGGESKQVKAMVWDFQVHPIKQVLTHVDLKSIDPEVPVQATVPVKSSGTHAGAIYGGLLSWARHEIEISAKPEDIPTHVTLDVTPLALGEALHISDIPLPEGVSFSDSPKLTVVTCIAPKGMKSDKKAAAAEEEAK